MRKYFKNDILRLSKPIDNYKNYVVYFLIQNKTIVYVGYTSDFSKRLVQHKLSEKIFDRYFLIKCKDKEQAIEIENQYIKEFNPIFNGQYCDKSLSEKDGIQYKKPVPKVYNLRNSKRTYEIMNFD